MLKLWLSISHIAEKNQSLFPVQFQAWWSFLFRLWCPHLNILAPHRGTRQRSSKTLLPFYCLYVCVCVIHNVSKCWGRWVTFFMCVVQVCITHQIFTWRRKHKWQKGVKTGLEVGPKRETCLKVYFASVLHFTAGRRVGEKWHRGAELVTAAASAPWTAPQFLALYFFLSSTLLFVLIGHADNSPTYSTYMHLSCIPQVVF